MGLGSWDSWKAANSGIDFEPPEEPDAERCTPSFAAMHVSGGAAVAAAASERVASDSQHGQTDGARHPAMDAYQGYFSLVRD